MTYPQSGGADTLSGGNGSDMIVGGSGNDFMTWTVTISASDDGTTAAVSDAGGFGTIGPDAGFAMSLLLLAFSLVGIALPVAALFVFGFGPLAAGDTLTFYIYYGAAGNEADALAALGFGLHLGSEFA